MNTSLLPPIFPPPPMPGAAAASASANMFPNPQPPMPNQMNNSILADQSMLNNVSFQSERTPFNPNRTQTNFANLNTTIPSSASALQTQMQQTKQPQPVVNQQQVLPPFNPSQPPPFAFSQNLPAQTAATTTTAANPIKFAPPINTTSTPQTNQFAFKQQQQQQQPPVVDSKPKLPLFNLSPAKPLTDATNKEPAKSESIFGANLFKPAAEQPKTLFGGGELFKAPQPTTLANEDDEENDQGGNPEEYEPKVDFKPIVHLTEVEVKTGEEDELVLFKQRCKLFRFASETKEWKEKGTGEMKILKHKQTGHIRLLMRRDQVLKLCANHRITPELKLNEISPKQLSWVAVDFAENEPKNELLLAKFANEDNAKQFKTEFEKAVEASKSSMGGAQPVASMTKSASQPASNKPSLAQLLKNDNWSCTGCYASNKKEDLKCPCCATAKPGAQIPTSNTSPALNKPNEPPKFSFGLPPATTASTTTPNKALVII